MKSRYFSLIKNESTKEADINIFGDITSEGGWFSSESDVSSYKLSKQLEELSDVDTINVHISSYGGEVKEGLAIYNALKNHKAKVKTYCDGFACSIASVIFMAGDERIMSKASLLMIHNAWIFTQGNADELRKQAEDLDKITSASINAYMENVNISEKELKKLLNKETWLTYDECLEMGFATSVTSNSNDDKASQNVKQSLINMILQSQKEKEVDDEEEPDVTTDDEYDVDTPDTDEPDTDDGTDDDPETDDGEDKNNNETEVTNEKVVAFFNAMIGGMKE